MNASGLMPEALSGFVKFHPQYPVLKVPDLGFYSQIDVSIAA